MKRKRTISSICLTLMMVIFEYSAVSTNLTLSAGALWDFMARRGGQEKTFAELKGEWDLDVVPTHHYGTNSAWQQISILGHNLLRNFQLQTLAIPKPRSRKRTSLSFLQSLKTLRFKLIHQPARLVKPQGYQMLRFSVAPHNDSSKLSAKNSSQPHE
jgi:hypothetical protein